MVKIFKGKDESKDAPKPVKKAVKKTAAKAEKAPARATAISEAASRVFLKPLVSEKTARLGGDDIYAFVVNDKTNKAEIKKAFVEMYGVRPVGVNILNMWPKPKRGGFHRRGKKALIRLPKGSQVRIFEGV